MFHNKIDSIFKDLHILCIFLCFTCLICKAVSPPLHTHTHYVHTSQQNQQTEQTKLKQKEMTVQLKISRSFQTFVVCMLHVITGGLYAAAAPSTWVTFFIHMLNFQKHHFPTFAKRVLISRFGDKFVSHSCVDGSFCMSYLFLSFSFHLPHVGPQANPCLTANVWGTGQSQMVESVFCMPPLSPIVVSVFTVHALFILSDIFFLFLLSGNRFKKNKEQLMNTVKHFACKWEYLPH